MSADAVQLREFTEPHWFRVEGRTWGDGDGGCYAELIVKEILVSKHTPKGAWLNQGFSSKRFVLRDYVHRARAYAAPTLEQAKEDFRKRKLYQISCLQLRIDQVRRQLDLVSTANPILELP